MQFTDNNSSHPDLQGVQVRLADHLQLGERVSYYIVLFNYLRTSNCYDNFDTVSCL